VEHRGDALARYRLRAREIAVSTAVAHDLTGGLHGAPGSHRTVQPAGPGSKLSLVEA
jgi:Ni,Fe-hydrogenase III large subunit